jgi:hypothetical protein
MGASMDDIFDCWVDEKGRVITQSSISDGADVEVDPVLESGFAHMSWNEGGVVVSYSAERVKTGALRGLIRQIRQIKRPIEIKRHLDGNWNLHNAATGAAAVDFLKRDES